MPKIQNLTPLAIEHQAKYGPQIKETRTGYAFNMPVVEANATIDLSFLDSDKRRLDIALPIDAKDCKLILPAGIEVHAQDNFNSYAKVRVSHPDSDKTYKVRDSVHEAKHDRTNANGRFKMKDLSWDLDKYPVAQSKYLTMVKKEVDEGDPHIGEFWCRHLAVASIVTKQARELEKQNPPPEGTKTLPWWVKRSQEMFKLDKTYPTKDVAEMDFYKMKATSPNVFRLENFSQMKTGIGSLLKMLSVGLHPATEKAKDYLVILRSDCPDTPSHALHLSLKAKLEPDFGVLYKAKLYDPNTTYTHKSIATKDLNVILDTTNIDWFAQDYDFYSRPDGFKSIRFFEVPPDWDTVEPSPDLVQNFYVLNSFAMEFPKYEQSAAGIHY